MQSSRGMCLNFRSKRVFNITFSEGAANLNDMKDMLANLPQYQEQREKVYTIMLLICAFLTLGLVLAASQHGPRMYGHIREAKAV